PVALPNPRGPVLRSEQPEANADPPERLGYAGLPLRLAEAEPLEHAAGFSGRGGIDEHIDIAVRAGTAAIEQQLIEGGALEQERAYSGRRERGRDSEVLDIEPKRGQAV